MKISPIRLILFSAVWCLGLVLGYWLGSDQRVAPAGASETDRDASEPVEDAGADRAEASVSAPDAAEALEGERLQAGEISVTGLSMREIAALEPATLRALVGSALAMPKADPNRADLVSDLLGQLARTHPLEALELAERIDSLRDHEDAREAILESWGETDPVAALAWANRELANLPSSLRHAQMRALFRGYARNNPAAAFTAARQMDLSAPGAGRLQSQLMEEVLEVQVEAGEVRAALGAIDELPADSALRREMLRELVDEWASFDPESAAAYVEGLGDAATPELKTALLSEWAENDPAAAADWLSRLPEGDSALPHAATLIIREWARYDLTASAEWLNSLPASPELDRAVASYTFRAAQEDPASAMSWAESISNDRMRGGMMERVAVSWKESDPEAFAAYIEASDFDEGQKERLQNAQTQRGGWWRYR